MEARGDTLKRRVAAIRDDRVHGAGFLAQRAIWVVAQAALDPGATMDSVTAAARELAQLRPEMASLANGVRLLLERLQGADLDQAPTLATELIAEVQQLSERAARNAAARLPEGGTVLTCSYSATVVQALVVSRRRRRRVQARVLPSAGHGARTVEEARRDGVDAEVISTLPRDATPDTTVGLIGADAVYPGAFVVNGAPSLGLARWCADRGLSLYVVCDSLKIAAQPPPQKLALPRGMERIPLQLVTAIITESTP